MPDDSSSYERKELTEILQGLMGRSTQRQFAARCGVHQTTIHDILSPPYRIPTLPTIMRIADRLGMDANLRRQWFAAAGYDDPRARSLEYEAILEDETLDALRGLRDVSPEDRARLNAEMRRLIDERRPPSE